MNMKKNVLLIPVCVWALAFMPATAHSQGFLKKLKQKVENAVVGTDASEENADDESTEGEPASGTPTPADKIPKLRMASSSWDEMIQPSKASTVKALLDELPALPSVDAMVAPTEEGRASYYRKIVAVDMRVEELDEQRTCSDEEMLAAREKLYQEMIDITGLTVEEMKRLEDPNLPEAEKEQLAEKARNAMISGSEMDRLTAMGAEMEKREKAKGGKLSDEEMMQLVSENPDAMADMTAVATRTMETSAKVQAVTARFNKLNRQLQQVSEKQKQLAKQNQGVITSCQKIAEDYEKKLKKIYEQIFATEDRREIDKLYAQADELMKNYRGRAAKLWRNSLQAQLDEAKALLPEMENVYKEMVKEEMIPACAANRASYNLVTCFTDILHKAYSDFPQPDVLPVQMESILVLKKHEYLWAPESGFASSVTDFLANSRILVYDGETKERYVYENGQRRKLTDKDPSDFRPKTPRTEPAYNTWTSESGVRKVTYTRDGSVTLHDGTSFYPLAFQQQDNKLVWIIVQNHSIVKCTYKL